MKKKLPKNNPTKNEIEALKDLSIRDNIIITKADKGRAVVIIDAVDYISEVNRQLNKEFYKKLPSDKKKNLNRKSQQCNQKTKR